MKRKKDFVELTPGKKEKITSESVTEVIRGKIKRERKNYWSIFPHLLQTLKKAVEDERNNKERSSGRSRIRKERKRLIAANSFLLSSSASFFSSFNDEGLGQPT